MLGVDKGWLKRPNRIVAEMIIVTNVAKNRFKEPVHSAYEIVFGIQKTLWVTGGFACSTELEVVAIFKYNLCYILMWE